ncbi:MAG: copper chaperone PCu(A)C [Brucellaceae bacterium]|uniref:copper chaperone PCu(A)C n=1 Tax=Zhengella sp. TaxID=2282762 RepID=UPI001D8A1156|nr:copper chaperone PCu(A)C [Notoacmeibacter sp.]MCC0025561.1 copper chaperone PCu(A)C [Brucellaceae bacterium]
MKHTLKIITLAAALALPGLAAVHPAMAEEKAAMQAPLKAGDLELTGFWTRAMLPNQPAGGGFVTIRNSGSADDRLLKVETPLARGEVHEMAVVDGVMRMRELADGLPIPAGETVELKPGSFHMMFLEVKEPFREGGTVPVTLTFEKAGTVEAELTVMPFDHGRMKMNQGDGKGMMHGGGHGGMMKQGG